MEPHSMEPVTQTQTTTVDVETTVCQDRPTTFNDTMQSLATDTEVDRFVDSLILPDDFVLDSERTKVIFIKGVAMKQISVKVLRKICVRYKVSGYKNAKKAFTVALIARLLKRESLSQRIYPRSFNVNESDIELDSDNDNHEDSSINDEEFKVDEDCEDDNDERNEKVQEATAVQPHESLVDPQFEQEEVNPPVKKAKKNKAQAKSTPPDAVTCINTYFRVINVYMCNKHRSDVLRLGQPPTLAELDARRFRHKFIFDRLVVTYNDDEDDDCIILAFPEDEYWDQVGIDADYAKKYDVLTSKDFSLVMGYINHHYQVAYRKNKQSGNHDDFVKFVGSRHFLYYYHLWLCQVPHLLNFAVPLLPKYAFRESIDIDDTATTLSSKSKSSSNFSVRKKGRHAILTQKPTSSSQNLAIALESFEKSNVAKLRLLESTTAPRRENDLLDVLDKYKVRLRVAREELEELENKDYDSSSSDIVQARLEIALCKRKRDQVFNLLSQGDTLK